MTQEQYETLTPLFKFGALIDVLQDCADRCNKNMLVADSWISGSFEGAAERLEELQKDLLPYLIKEEMERDKKLMAKVKRARKP